MQNENRSFIGIDVGGTFTDCIVFRDGSFSFHKVFSTPHSPADSVLGLLDQLAAEGLFEAELSHGTTVATNAVLERKVARTVLVTTQGFKDTLFIGRQQRPHLYDFTVTRSEHVVREENCLEVKERIAFDGTVVTPLEDETTGSVLERLKMRDPEAVAICLLFAFRNPVHERVLADRIAAYLDCPVSCSSVVSPEIREYERMSTTCLDASLKPLVRNYINKIERGVEKTGIHSFFVMQSNGGVNVADEIRNRPASLVLSGPAGGVSACRDLAEQVGVENLIGLDMGGTSTDVSVIADGRITTVEEGFIDGLPLQLPMINIETIGAGGGSIAWIDDGGLLKVGPVSAGADPGPVCYDRGGEQITVSDANLVLGYLPANFFLGGSYQLNIQKTRDLAEKFADGLGLSLEQSMLGIIKVVNISMLRALNVITSSRGLDPRDFSLVPFGGAGPLHAAALAREIGIREVIVPVGAGLFSAVGLMTSDITQDFTRSMVFDLAAEGAENNLNRVVDHLILEAGKAFSMRHYTLLEEHVHPTLNLRYRGQNDVIEVSWNGSVSRASARFSELHNKRFGYALPGSPVETASIKVRVLLAKQGIHCKPGSTGKPRIHSVKMFVEQSGCFETVPLYIRETLSPGFSLAGPAIIAEDTATTVVHQEMTARIDALGNIRIEVIA